MHSRPCLRRFFARVPLLLAPASALFFIAAMQFGGWAIGTGEVCASDEANRVCGIIRATVASKFGAQAGEAVRIQYGGSVKPDNARELLSLEHIDGALVGGASLKADSFAQIVQAARQ